MQWVSKREYDSRDEWEELHRLCVIQCGKHFHVAVRVRSGLYLYALPAFAGQLNRWR